MLYTCLPILAVCIQPPVKGPNVCHASIRAYYYDAQAQECKSFIYGGCNASGNLFGTAAQCERVCGKGHCIQCAAIFRLQFIHRSGLNCKYSELETVGLNTNYYINCH